MCLNEGKEKRGEGNGRMEGKERDGGKGDRGAFLESFFGFV